MSKKEVVVKNGGSATKQLSEAEKFKMLNVHLNDQVFELQAQLAKVQADLASVRLDNVRLRKELNEQTNVTPFFRSLGIARGDALELRDDGTLLINKGRAPEPPKKEPAKAEAKEEKKAAPVEVEPLEPVAGGADGEAK